MNPDLVVEIVIRTPYHCRATGYVIGPDRILTSGHLGQEETVIPKDTVVEVYFEAESPGAGRVQKAAKVIWSAGELLDCAVLECSAIPDSKKRLSCRIRYETLQTPLAFRSRVWCDAGIESNNSEDPSKRRPTDVSGNAAVMSSGQQYFEVDCVDCSIPSTEKGWKGASGGAVFVENELAGVIRRYPSNFEGKKLLVVPICSLMEADGFAHAGRMTKAEKANHDRLRQSIKDELPYHLRQLRPCTHEWTTLLNSLNVEASDKDDVTIDKVVTKLLDDVDLFVEVQTVVGKCLRRGQTDGVMRLIAVQDLLLPLWLDPGIRRRLYHELRLHEVAIVHGAAATPVGAELAAAHIHQRSTNWVIREREIEAAKRHCVEGSALFWLPEGLLKQPTIESVAAAFLRSLAIHILEPRFFPEALRAWKETVSNEVQVAMTDGEEEQYRRDLPVALANYSTSGRDTPYCAMKLHSEGQQREDQLAMLQSVRKVVPNLLILELCEPERPNPQELQIATNLHGRFNSKNERAEDKK